MCARAVYAEKERERERKKKMEKRVSTPVKAYIQIYRHKNTHRFIRQIFRRRRPVFGAVRTMRSTMATTAQRPSLPLI